MLNAEDKSMMLSKNFLKSLSKKPAAFKDSQRRKKASKVVEEPEELGEIAERETMEVQAPLEDESSVRDRFAYAAALYNSWGTELCDCIDRYFYGGSKQEVEGVIYGLDTRIKEILTINKERVEILRDLWTLCVDQDDSLTNIMAEEALSSRIISSCEKWKQNAVLALNAFDDSDGAYDEMSEGERHGVEVDLEKKLQQALLAGETEEEQDDDTEDDGGGDARDVPSEADAQESKEDKEKRLHEMEERGATIAAEREKQSKERQSKRSLEGNALDRASTSLDKEGKKDEVTARKEIEQLAAQNEGVVHRLAELAKKSEDGAEDAAAEHRAEIAKLKQEGESLKARMARLAAAEEEKHKGESSEARKELEQLREQQKGRTRKKADAVLTPEEKMEQLSQQREEIERMRVERATQTRKIGSDILASSKNEELGPLDGSRRAGDDVAKKFLSEAEKREKEKMDALLAKLEKQHADDFSSTPEIDSLLASLENKMNEHEQHKKKLEEMSVQMEKKKNARERQRDEQMAARRKREEDKKREEMEFAQWQAERQKKSSEKNRFRDLKRKAELGQALKCKLGVIGPHSGKTALVKRYMEGKFDPDETDTSIDQLYEKYYEVKGQSCLLQILDTTSMAEFATFRAGWYESCDGFLVVIDLTRKASRTFKKLRVFAESIKEAKKVSDLSSVPIVVVATKEDLFEKRKVKAGEVLSFAKEWGAKYVEVSAKTGENVEAAFETCISAVMAQNDQIVTPEKKSEN